MNFLSRAIQKMRGYEAVAADAPPQEFMIDGQSCSEKEYRQLKQKTIRIIQAIPVTYLSRDKADAAIDALRTGRDPTDEHLFDEVWDAAMKHRDDLHAQKTA
ncbi:hypothetical protein pmac_cds_401 [Pandoravirus macleodensis]|uniref:Uncharacterized protein n=1 Tax=Pandoravirus macleodensis TaxID=2107707 RepID=A0A2U7UF37_9VIRU|nr:hypothetical protein pmac_cds_401 [Pandoravirus macleodensis]AVK77089.1 hypothetical protein pmac_cds_401 [Pandoravirus macleodensis]